MDSKPAPVVETVVAKSLAQYTRLILKITLEDWSSVPRAFDHLRPHNLDSVPKSQGHVSSGKTQIVESAPNTYIDGADFIRVLGEIYDFRDATVSCNKNQRQQPEIRVSCRRSDPQNPVKANYALDEPEFQEIMSEIQRLDGFLIVYSFLDPYAAEKGDSVLVVELRKARLDHPTTPKYERKLHLDGAIGLYILRFSLDHAPLKPLAQKLVRSSSWRLASKLSGRS